MSTNHRAEAERLLAGAQNVMDVAPVDGLTRTECAALAQVHATLARNEEQAASSRDLKDVTLWLRRRERATRSLVSAHIAEALASREAARWKAGRDLAQALDEADCNMDTLIDARLSDDGWDPRSAWKAVASAVPAADPWAATPDVTAEVPERVRRVLTERIAVMLLDSRDDALAEAARTLAFALKNEGADLTGDIEKRITELTLGRDPSDPPF